MCCIMAKVEEAYNGDSLVNTLEMSIRVQTTSKEVALSKS